MESYMISLLQGFLADGDEVHIHTYEVDRQLASQYPCGIHKKNLFLLPRRLRKYYFLHSCNAHFDRDTYDLSLSLTRSSCQDVAIVGGVHPESVALTPRRNRYRRMHDAMEIRFETKMFDRVPCIVAHSASIKEEIIRHYNSAKKKVRVLYPPIDDGQFKVISSAQRLSVQKIFGINQDKMTLLFPSLGHKRKGLQELITAFRHLDSEQFELLIAGEKVKKIKQVPENIRYVGYVENLADLYSAVDYSVLPSHYEPFGLIVVESLQCGTPVLVTKNVGAAELLSKGEGVVINDNHPDTLIAAIKRLEKKEVLPGFAENNGLIIGQHIQEIKRVALEMKGRGNRS